MRVYTQLTQEQRYQIYVLMKAEHYQAEIAAIVGVDKSTISREVRRDRVSIEERPTIVEHSRRLGDWELDTIIGKGHRQALVSLTERKSRLALLVKVSSKGAEGVKRAVPKLLRPLSDWVHTLTSDNGKEVAHHEAIAEALDAEFYFAHPFASWERGLNENTNGLVRQYFPKGCDFTAITQNDTQKAMDKLNNRPLRTPPAARLSSRRSICCFI